jgi:hypothetical protein
MMPLSPSRMTRERMGGTLRLGETRMACKSLVDVPH